MSVRVAIVEGAVRVGPAPQPERGSVGARLVFEGIVRAMEDARAIDALEYEVYEPMATRQMESIAGGLAAELGLLSIDVWHSRGRVGVGECSLRVEVRSRHRGEGLAAMARFIEALKRDVPIWKRPVWGGAE